MTPEERAEKAMLLVWPLIGKWQREGAKCVILAAIREAILAEREACARMVESLKGKQDFDEALTRTALASAIRGRSQP